MEKYKNLSGDSGVIAYEIGIDYIKLQFRNDGVYLYDYTKPGKRHVEQMKTWAVKGDGLTTYLNKYVRENYAKKLS